MRKLFAGLALSLMFMFAPVAHGQVSDPTLVTNIVQDFQDKVAEVKAAEQEITDLRIGAAGLEATAAEYLARAAAMKEQAAATEDRIPYIWNEAYDIWGQLGDLMGISTPMPFPSAPEPVEPEPVAEEPVVVEVPVEEPAPVETPVVEEPAVEEVPVETPVVEAPVVVETPVEEAPAPVTEETPVEAPVVEETPVVEEAPVEAPLPVEEAPLPVEEAPVTEEVPVVEEAPVEAPLPVEEPVIAEETPVEVPVVEEAPVEVPAIEEPVVGEFVEEAPEPVAPVVPASAKTPLGFTSDRGGDALVTDSGTYTLNANGNVIRDGVEIPNTAGMDFIQVARQGADLTKTTIRAYGWGSSWRYEPVFTGADSVGWVVDPQADMGQPSDL